MKITEEQMQEICSSEMAENLSQTDLKLKILDMIEEQEKNKRDAAVKNKIHSLTGK